MRKHHTTTTIEAQVQPIITGELYGQSQERYQEKSARKEKSSQTQIILCGHGISLKVERGALYVKDGFCYDGQKPMSHILYKGMHTITHIHILASNGNLTIDALNWCQSQSITVSIIDYDGGLKQCLTPEPASNAPLRRKQYLASEGDKARAIAYELLCKKTHEQVTLLKSRSISKDEAIQARAIHIFEESIDWLDVPGLPRWRDIAYMRTFEGRLAKVYWAVFESVEIKWSKSDAKIIPLHWKKADIRASYLNKNHGARNATSPFHAMLNYAYACLEGKVRQSLVKVGVDLSCAFLHADKPGRDSLVYDLIELYRSKVDGLLLDLVRKTTFKRGDFIPVSDGSVRLSPMLAKYVVLICSLEQGEIDKGAIWLRDLLLQP